MDRLAVVRRRQREQRLVSEPFATPAEAVAWFGAVQSQELAEAKWSLGQRTRDCTDADVEAACDRGEILRTHILRPTWHFVAPADIRWIQRLTAPRVQAFNRYWYRQQELEDDIFAGSHEVLAATLQHGEPLTRPELGAALAEAGIEAKGPRLGHIAMHAELEQLLCSGPRRGKQNTYLLLDQRAPAAPDRSRQDDLAELTLRYFRSHGPATVKDFRWWSSLTVADANAGLAAVGNRLASEPGDDGKPWYAAPSPARGPSSTGALFLGAYDETVVAYQDLKIVLAKQPPETGMLSRPIVVDGRTVGSWKRSASARAVTVEATLFTALDAAGQQALSEEADRFGRFVGLPVTLEQRVVGSA